MGHCISCWAVVLLGCALLSEAALPVLSASEEKGVSTGTAAGKGAPAGKGANSAPAKMFDVKNKWKHGDDLDKPHFSDPALFGKGWKSMYGSWRKDMTFQVSAYNHLYVPAFSSVWKSKMKNVRKNPKISKFIKEQRVLLDKFYKPDEFKP